MNFISLLYYDDMFETLEIRALSCYNYKAKKL